MNKIKKFVINNKAKIVGTTTTLALGVSQIASAAETSSVTASITSSFQTIVTDTLSTIAAVAPIAITIFGAMFVWNKARKFFKDVSK